MMVITDGAATLVLTCRGDDHTAIGVTPELPSDQNCQDLAWFLVQMRGEAVLEFARRLADAPPNPCSETGRAWRRVSKAVENLMNRTDRRRWTDR